VAGLSVDGWQPNEDAVMMQSQRLVSSMLSDTAVLALAHHHAEFVLDGLRHIKPVKVSVY